MAKYNTLTRHGSMIALVATSVFATPAQARTDVSPYLEVGQIATADLKNGGDVLTYSTVAAGVDASKVRIENVGFPVREPMLMQGKVDAIVGFAYSAIPSLQANGIKPEDISVMYMRDFGLELFGNALLVGPQYLRENPDTVRKFIRASIRGFMEVANNPAEGMASVLKRNPVTTEAAEKARLSIFMNDNFFTSEIKANGVGFVDPARLARSIDQIGESFKFTNKPRPDDFYTDAFLPPRAERQVPAAIAARRY